MTASDLTTPALMRSNRHLRLDTLVRLRWLAIAGQSVAVAGVHFGLGFLLPFGWCFGVIAISAWLNIALRVRFPLSHRLRDAPATALLIYHVWVIDHAKAFADLVEASFDLYRHSLYTQLRWPLPKNPAAEFTAGQAINAYLLRGARSTTPSFESPPAKAP